MPPSSSRRPTTPFVIPAPPSWGVRVLAAAGAACAWAAAWRRVERRWAQDRSELDAMSDRELSDLGIGRDQVSGSTCGRRAFGDGDSARW